MSIRQTLSTTWNKICEDTAGRIWFSGGDHWGTDRKGGIFETRYERPWGFGNTSVCYFDPSSNEVVEAFELGRASGIYANRESPGHGKIHADIVADEAGFIWTGGYMGSSYGHEFNDAFYPRSYVGGALLRYDPEAGDIDYYGIPNPGGALVSVKYDIERRVVHGVTVDRCRYFRVNIDTMELRRYEILRNSGREIIVDNRGRVWYPNEFSSLTRFDPDTETYTDYDISIPGLRASVVSSDGIIYGICPNGFLWSWDTLNDRVEDLGHITTTPEQRVYTPNLALDEEWGRLYCIAGGHGITLAGGMPIMTIYDIAGKQLYWAGKIDVEGCFGAVAARDHRVYFCCYAMEQENGRRIEPENPHGFRMNYLVAYTPPRDLKEVGR